MPFSTAGVFTPLFRFGSSTKADTQFQPQVDADIQDIAAGLTLLETQVGSTGSGSAPGGTAGNVQYNNSGIFGGYTDTQLTSHVNLFTATTSGAAPLSGGGTANYLRADGTWAAPAVGTASSTPPGGSNLQIQYNNASAFGGLTDTQVTARINVFTSTLKGATPQSGGGTLNFLRADGNWALPSTTGAASIAVGSSTVTGGVSGKILYDDGGVVGELPTTGSGGIVVLGTSPTLGGTVNLTGLLQVQSANATLQNSFVLTPSVAQIIAGDNGPHLVTTINPTIAISRQEGLNNLNTSGGQNAALYVEAKGNNTAGANNPQTTSITAYSSQYGTGDSAGIVSVAGNNSTSGHFAAFGGYFAALANTTGINAIGLQFGINNNSGADYDWASFSAGGQTVAAGIDCPAQGTNLCTVGMYLRNGGKQWDVGFASLPTSVKTSFLQDDSSSINVLKSATSHTNGVDFSSATFSGAPMIAPLMTPANSSATGVAGSIKWDDSFIYICTSTNTWKRAALSTF